MCLGALVDGAVAAVAAAVAMIVAVCRCLLVSFGWMVLRSIRLHGQLHGHVVPVSKCMPLAVQYLHSA